VSNTPALREKVRAQVLDELLHHRLPPASRIREDAMASQLGISRTPLREALFALAHDGLIETNHERGFSVKPLSAREVREIYPIIWTLEALALETSRGNFSTIVPHLRAINNRFANSVFRPRAALRQDVAWHAKLTSLCRNKWLAELLSRMKQLTYRYEYLYMSNAQLLLASVKEHEAITREIAAGRIGRALPMLRRNWERTMKVLLNQLDWI